MWDGKCVVNMSKNTHRFSKDARTLHASETVWSFMEDTAHHLCSSRAGHLRPGRREVKMSNSSLLSIFKSRGSAPLQGTLQVEYGRTNSEQLTQTLNWTEAINNKGENNERKSESSAEFRGAPLMDGVQLSNHNLTDIALIHCRLQTGVMDGGSSWMRERLTTLWTCASSSTLHSKNT